MKLIQRPDLDQCPYCLARVGILGNWIARLMGTQFHGCDFSNIAVTGDEVAARKIVRMR